MSIFKLFAYTLRSNLPKLPKTPVFLSTRFVTAMDLATENIEKDQVLKSKDNTRFRKRFMKRQWEDNDNRKQEGESDGKKSCEPTERIKKKKMVLLLGYCGVDYYGMQRNPGVKTIEEDLLKALLDVGYITEADFTNQQNAQFQRSSRTDKGVSAARQVVSLKLPLEIKVEEINKRLPDCIKVFGVKRVTNKFNSKVKCNARTYSYTLPTFVFEPKAVTNEERRQYRISKDKLDQINKVLGVYKGTKSYHNFTEKKHYQDPSASRYMMGFSVEKVFVDSDMEFAVLLVKGQSFMLHQIRKMVGLVVAVIRGLTDESVLEKAFGKEKVMIPTAPGLGLVLDRVHYDRYAARYKDSHDSLSWEAEEEAIDKFKHEHIYPTIIKGELEDNSMGQWLEKLSLHNYEPADDAPDKEADKVDEDYEDDDSGKNEEDSTKNEEDSATNEEDSAKNEEDSATNEEDSAKNERDSSKNEESESIKANK